MGAEQHKFTNDKPSGKKSQKIIPTEYQICYQHWLADPHYIDKLFTENQTLIANILYFFPDARQSYDLFLEMVFFLRSYDPEIKNNEFAKYNVHHTTLLDRFFMLILKIAKYELLDEIVVDVEKMEDLFLELMKLFIHKPRKGFIIKLLKFISLKDVKQISLKDYSAKLRQFLPHIQKHIKDYYTIKFFHMKPEGHLLENFKSDILVEDAVLLSMKVSELTNPKVKLLYEPRTSGTSFHAILKGILGYTGPWLLIIEHVEKDKNGNNVVCHFGSYQMGPINDLNSFQGDPRGFMFETSPKIRLYSTDKGSGGSYYFFINSLDEKISKLRRGIGFGGTSHKENFKLWIDQDLDRSTVFNGHDQTYGFGSMVNPSTTKLNIIKMQIWALGTEQDLKNLELYRDAKSSEIQKRRKVNKSELLTGDVGLVFENTFAHRDQVYGEIDKRQQKPKQQKH